MASFKALCLAGVASLVAPALSHAADLLPPPPPVEAPIYVPPPAAIGGGWYLRGDVGVGINQLSESASTCTNASGLRVSCGSAVANFAYNGYGLDETAILGAGVGYQFNAFFRADVTGEYRFGGHYHAVETATGCNAPNGPCADQYRGNISSGVVLANGYVDLGTWYRVTPYVGGGVGVAFNTFSGLHDYNLNYFGADSGAALGANTTTNFAWALMAGFAYDLTPNLKLDFGYRYLDMGTARSAQISCYQSGGCPLESQSYHLASHDIRIGLRYAFADLVPMAPAPQLPLIRKY